MLSQRPINFNTTQNDVLQFYINVFERAGNNQMYMLSFIPYYLRQVRDPGIDIDVKLVTLICVLQSHTQVQA